MRSVTVDGGRCRYFREERALTLEELAALVETQLGRSVHITMLSKIERGHRQPGAKLFDAMRTALRVPREALLLAPDGSR